VLHHFLIDNFIHYLEPFHSFLLSDANILLLQWNWSERVVKEEQTVVKVDTEKPCNITIVWQRRRECHQPHILLRRLYVTDRPVKTFRLHSL